MDFEIFQKTYVYTNIPEGSPTYNQDLLDKLRQDLSKHDGGNVPCIAVELLVSFCILVNNVVADYLHM